MIDDRIKLLAKRIEQEKPTVYQISLWIDELIKLRLQEEWLDSERLTKEIEVMQSNQRWVINRIDEIAESHRECPGCEEIHTMLNIGIASYVVPQA